MIIPLIKINQNHKKGCGRCWVVKMEFSTSMNGDQLCAYLEEQGIEGDDLKKIKGRC